MTYERFINLLKFEINHLEAGLKASQVVDYYKDHLEMDDTAFLFIEGIIEKAKSDAAAEYEVKHG